MGEKLKLQYCKLHKEKYSLQIIQLQKKNINI